jgi:hypothetical protein
MIFISDETRLSGVFFLALVKPTAGDPMIKLIASALLSAGIATAAMAADMPKSAAPMAADTPAAAGSTAPAKPAGKGKHGGKKGKKSTPAPSTTK